MTQIQNENLFTYDKRSQVEVLASSGDQFRIELIKTLDDNDSQKLINIAREINENGLNDSITPATVRQIFNYPRTFPVLARLNGDPLACIVGVPLEHFNKESWVKCDRHWGDGSTVYTQHEIISPRYRKHNYMTVLGRMYMNYLAKRGFLFVTGHKKEGTESILSSNCEIVEEFMNWQKTYQTYEYYRIRLQ